MKKQIIYIKFLISILVITSIINGKIENSTNEVKLDIAHNQYIYDHCCWAAVCQTVLQYYKIYKSQDDIIIWAADSQLIINYMCNHNSPKSIDTILSYFAKIPVQSDSCASNYIDINKVKSEIDHDRPIIGLWKFWYGPPINLWKEEGIFCVIFGYNPTSPIYHIWVEDPFSGPQYYRYDSLTYSKLRHDDVRNCDVYGKWVETLTLGGSNTNPPGPNPPFNPVNQNTISQRVIPAVITTIIQTILKKVP